MQRIFSQAELIRTFAIELLIFPKVRIKVMYHSRVCYIEV